MAQGVIEILADELPAMPTTAILDIIFVHGLGGNRVGSWQRSTETFWPRWLAVRFPDCHVFTFGYDSNKLAGFLTGDGASLLDLSGVLADALLSRDNAAPYTLLICHSLGGLIVKQMLRRCVDSSDSEYVNLGKSIVGIAFLGTPHQGASLASVLENLVRPFLSRQAKQLVYGEEILVDLNEFFRSRVSSQSITVRSYYETEKTGGILIVDKVTANPGVLGGEITAVQSDHIGICKPENDAAPIYKSICRLIRKLLDDKKSPTDAGRRGPLTASSQTDADIIENPSSNTLETASPEVLSDFENFMTVADDDRRDLAQKLTDVGRSYAIRDAEKKKERFNMALQRHIAQPAAVIRYTRLMSEVESRFKRHVARAIADGVCNATIDGIIQDNVITPCALSHSSKEEPVTAGLVDGALYYLAGNCHLAWDNG